MKKTINKRFVETLPFAAAGTDYFLDAKLAGFGLRVGKTKKVFIVEKRVRGKTVRVKIGEFPLVTVEHARRKAVDVLAQMSEGINPNQTRPGGSLKNLTLAHALKDYLGSRSLKPRTQDDVERSFRTKLKDWLERPIHELTRDEVLQRHAELVEKSGPAQANQCMRYLRSVLNFAKPRYKLANGAPLLKENPVLVLTETRSWKRVPRRQTVIQRKDLGPWFLAVLEIRETHPGEVTQTICDYLLVLLLTGLRRGEATQLKWDQVDLEAGVLTIADTKNHEPHRLPLSDFLWSLFKERYQARVNEYVFQGREGGCGHIVTPQKTMNQVAEKCGVAFCSHDLRRTFTSIAEALGISSYTIKRLLNHKITREITGGYIVRGYDQERLREPVQRITDFVLGEAGIGKELLNGTL